MLPLLFQRTFFSQGPFIKLKNMVCPTRNVSLNAKNNNHSVNIFFSNGVHKAEYHSLLNRTGCIILFFLLLWNVTKPTSSVWCQRRPWHTFPHSTLYETTLQMKPRCVSLPNIGQMQQSASFSRPSSFVGHFEPRQNMHRKIRDEGEVILDCVV